MNKIPHLILGLFLLVPSAVWGQSSLKEPHIGYLFPSGGQQNSVFRITVGGQNLKDTYGVHISGKGVSAEVIKHYKSVKRLSGDQRKELGRLVTIQQNKRIAALPENIREKYSLKQKKVRPAPSKPDDIEDAELPEHPRLENLNNLNLRELEFVSKGLFDYKQRQPNAQISETVVIKVRIDRKAKPGNSILA